MKVYTRNGRCRAEVECDCLDGWRYGSRAARCGNPEHAIARRIVAAGIPADLLDAVNGDLERNGQRIEILGRIGALLSSEIGGLILCGDSDTGKSHMAAYLATAAIRMGHSALWCMADDIDIAAKATFGTHETVPQGLARFINAPLLVIDEMKSHSAYSAAHIGMVIRGRYECAKGGFRPTIITSNGGEREMASALDTHIWKRLRSIAPVYEVVGKGWRGVAA